MLTLLHALHVASPHRDPYADPGVLTLAVSIGRSARRAWARLVDWHWEGHRRAAAR